MPEAQCGDAAVMSFNQVPQRWAISVALFITLTLWATEPPPPVITNFNYFGGMRSVRFAPYPGAQSYTIYSASNSGAPFTVNSNFVLSPYISGYTTIIVTNSPMLITNYGYEWRVTNSTAPSALYRVGVGAMSSNAMMVGHVLNRLAYGQTPDELERVTAIGAQAYINEQVNFQGVPDLQDNYVIVTTNSVASDPTTNWTQVTIAGTMRSSPLSIFPTAPVVMRLDDIDLRPSLYMFQISTNVVNGTNVYTTNRVFSCISPTNILVNGSFETDMTPWVELGPAAASVIDATVAHSGSSCLRFMASVGTNAPGTNYVRQSFPTTYQTTNSWGATVTTSYANTDPVTLTYWYLPGPSSSKVRLQLGSGIDSSPGGIPNKPAWTYVTATGAASSINRIYFYMTNSGLVYLDDIKLVAGTVPEAGSNLIQNGDFESALTPPWSLAARYSGSVITNNIAHGGGGSLLINGTSSGNPTTGASIYQTVAGLVPNQTYTLSYWYSPVTPGLYLGARLDGTNLVSSPDADLAGLNRKLNTGQAAFSDYRAWFCMRAVNSPRQLFEVMSQFWENHFVTQESKSFDYISGQGLESGLAGRVATQWEFNEMAKWRNAMLNPNCTFYDLLKISAESPAMIVYLDSVNSKGNGGNVANENYARELLELFTFGVDNGYDQEDIVRMSRAWSGWSVQFVDAENANDPFAPISLTYFPNTNNTSGVGNKVGVFAFNFVTGNHGTNRGAIFPAKTVPARFGPPWAGLPYQLALPQNRTTTNGIQDGYDVIAHLANLPFTSEYISVKLCRLFVHDDFPNPTTTANLPEYAFYDYTDPNRSAEAELVHQCMLAWENSSPKGNIRAVLNTIFNSDLFRSHTAVAQKVKTPLEFVASSLRAVRSTNANGYVTAMTDGYSFATPLNNMGQMLLFDRAAPDGYPENGPSWISAGSLVERIRFVQSLCMTNGAANRGDAGANFVDPVGLLKKKLTVGSWNNDGAVADYFLGVLFPGEGAGNLALYRRAATNYLNIADNGTNASAFNILSTTSGDYENRVRGMVGMLMGFQRFQEQ